MLLGPNIFLSTSFKGMQFVFFPQIKRQRLAILNDFCGFPQVTPGKLWDNMLKNEELG
jgi:hypothetical protein